MEYGSFVKKIFSRVFFLLITSCKTKKTRILSLRSQYVASKVQIVTDWNRILQNYVPNSDNLIFGVLKNNLQKTNIWYYVQKRYNNLFFGF